MATLITVNDPLQALLVVRLDGNRSKVVENNIVLCFVCFSLCCMGTSLTNQLSDLAVMTRHRFGVRMFLLMHHYKMLHCGSTLGVTTATKYSISAGNF